MDDWPAYANHTLANKAVFDQNTLNAVLMSSRAGFQTAPNIFMDSANWDSLVKEVRSSTVVGSLPYALCPKPCIALRRTPLQWPDCLSCL